MQATPLIAALLACTSAASAATLASWDYTLTTSANSVAPATRDPSVTVSNQEAYLNGVLSGNVGAGGLGFSAASDRAFGFFNNYSTSEALAAAGDDYFQFSIAPDGGQSLNLESIQFSIANANSGSSGTGTFTVFVRSSADNYGSTIGSIGAEILAATAGDTNLGNANFNLTGFAPLQGLTGTTVFRIFAYDNVSGGSGQAFRMDNFTLNGAVVPEPGSALAGALLLCGLLRRRR